MKNIIKAVFALVVVVLSTSQINAQDKIGHINSQELLSALPERTAVQEQLEKFYQQLQNQVQLMQQEYMTKTQEYQQYGETWEESIRQLKMEEIAQLEQRMQSFQQKAEEDMAAKQQALYQPLLDKAKTAVDEVAGANGYKYVFDSSPGGSLITFPESEDLMPLVKKHLGITIE